MAENETLELSSADANRWKRVVRALSQGAPDEVVVREVEKALYRGLRAAFKQMGARAGITLEDLLVTARRSSEELKALVNRTRGHDYARLLQQVATEREDRSTGGMARGFVHAVRDKVQDQLGNPVVLGEGCPSYPRARVLPPPLAGHPRCREGRGYGPVRGSLPPLSRGVDSSRPAGQGPWLAVG
jgi:hypothetical protein